MNTRETPKETLGSSETDIIRKVRGRSQTAKIASGVAGGILSLLPATVAMAEPQPLGTTALDSDEIAQVIYSANPNLDKPVPKEGRFDLIVNGFDVVAGTGAGDIYSKSFTLQRTPGSKTVKLIPLSKIAVVPGIPPANSYFPITNADGTVKYQIIDDGTIKVDGEIKHGYEVCGPSYSEENVHPTKKGIKILLYKTGGQNVLVADNLDAETLCDAPVDEEESTPFQPEAIPEIEFELGGQTHKLRGMAVYKEKYDQFKAQVNLDGVPYDRDASDPNNIKWKPENPVQGNADFIQTEWLNAFTIVETEEGPLIVGAIDAGNVKFIVFEPKVDPGTGVVVLEECPIEMGEYDPSASPLDDDGDGVPNSVEEATGGCIGYTDADKVDVNGDGESDTCQIECETYANQLAGVMTASDALPCVSNLGYEGAKQLKDGSTLHHNGTAPVLGDDGTIFAQEASKLRYIHATLVGAVDAPEPARNVVLPDGYEAEIQVHSGTAHVSGFDFLGDPVEVTVTPESGLVDLGFVYGAEVGVEGSDIEITVGNEYQPCGVAVCGNQNPEPAAAEQPQTVEEPMAQAETPVQQVEGATAEPPPAQAELPSQAEPPMPQAEPQTAEPTAAAEPMPDVNSFNPEPDAGADINVAEETGPVVIPPVDATISSPDADAAAVYVDAPPAGSDTPQGQDAPVDLQSADTALNPDTPIGTDTSADWTPGTETAGADTLSDAGADTAGTDAPVQAQDSQKDIPQGQFDTNQPDASQFQPDTSQPVGKDTENPQPKPEGKNEGDGGGDCAIGKSNDSSVLGYLAELGGVALAWASARRRRLAEVLERKKHE